MATKQTPKAIKPPKFQLTPINLLELDPRNPRKTINEADIDELAESIKEIGRIMQPIAIRAKGKKFSIIFGQRRWLAAKKLGLKSVETLIHDVSEATAYEMMLMENLQRIDIDPVEEAQGIVGLLSIGKSIAEIGLKLGKGAHWTASRIKLAKMPSPVQEMVSRGEVSLRHVEELARIEDAETLISIAGRCKWTTAQLIRQEIDGLLREIAKAPFPTLTAIGSLASCDSCPTRTDANADLFGPTESARCQNPQCWAKKLADYREKIIADLKKQRKKVLNDCGYARVPGTYEGYCASKTEIKEAKKNNTKPHYFVTTDLKIVECYPAPRDSEDTSEDNSPIGAPTPRATEIPTWEIKDAVSRKLAKIINEKATDLGIKHLLTIIAIRMADDDDELKEWLKIDDIEAVFATEVTVIEIVKNLITEAMRYMPDHHLAQIATLTQIDLSKEREIAIKELEAV